MVKHVHTLNKGMLQALIKISDFKIPVNLKDLDLTFNQRDNFQKLRYWNLVRKSYNAEGKRIGGHWEITELGLRFVNGEISMPQSAITYRGEVVEYKGENKYFSDVKELYKRSEDYSRDAINKD